MQKDTFVDDHINHWDTPLNAGLREKKIKLHGKNRNIVVSVWKDLGADENLIELT